MSYRYPLDEDWTKEEIIDVVNFFAMVEKAYEGAVKRDDFMLAYKRFKQIVPSASEEKRLCADFEKGSGYSAYAAVKAVKNSDKERITLKK